MKVCEEARCVRVDSSPTETSHPAKDASTTVQQTETLHLEVSKNVGHEGFSLSLFFSLSPSLSLSLFLPYSLTLSLFLLLLDAERRAPDAVNTLS